ncbi:MAG TPA: sulfite exporter TauE/SafE family protein [Vicinamibacterales bacterium]|jgi:uncharacterized membrane protein YfcA
MMNGTIALLAVLVALTILYVAAWIVMLVRSRRQQADASRCRPWPGPIELAIGLVTDFFDTLGIGNFATTTAAFKLFRLVPDERIPGTLNAGHTLPVVAEALIYVAILQVDMTTLVAMIGAAVAGAWLGAGIVARLPRRAIQIGMGCALLVAATLMLLTQFGVLARLTGETLSLSGLRFAVGVTANFVLGALMTLGIGLYAPCMILVSLLGMNPTAAFPIMMGSCAFLMPVGSLRFISLDKYSLRAALGLTIGGIPGVLLAAFLVKSLSLGAVRWLVVFVVVYAAVMMLRSAWTERAGGARVIEVGR